jgi:hypothetical protein
MSIKIRIQERTPVRPVEHVHKILDCYCGYVYSVIEHVQKYRRADDSMGFSNGLGV